MIGGLYHPSAKLHFRLIRLSHATRTIIPSLEAEITISHTLAREATPEIINLVIMPSEFMVMDKHNNYYKVAIAFPLNHRITVSLERTCTISFLIELDPYRLIQIERLREGRRLIGKLRIHFISFRHDKMPYMLNAERVDVNFEIPRDQWIETLDTLGLKRVSLIELPELEFEDLKQAIDYLNEAWRHYFRCDWDEVASNCRRAHNILSTYIRKKGYETYENDHPVPDWKKLYGKRIGNNLKQISKALHNFLYPGGHPGRFTKSDAQLALLIEHALINHVINRFKKSHLYEQTRDCSI